MRITEGMRWVERAWDVVVGCTKVSPGCRVCMAEQSVWRWNGRIYAPGFAPTEQRDQLELPKSEKTGRQILVAPLGDLFHRDISVVFVRQVLAVMRDTPQHTYYLLTKRPQRMQSVLSSLDFWPLPNVNIGTSTENQQYFDLRLPWLSQTTIHRKAYRYLSCEPLLGPITLGRYARFIKWLICGVERGRGAQPADEAWFRELKHQCRLHRIPVYHHRSESDRQLNKPGWLWEINHPQRSVCNGGN